MRKSCFILLFGLVLAQTIPLEAISGQTILTVLLHPLTKRFAQHRLSHRLPYSFDHKENVTRILAMLGLDVLFFAVKLVAPQYLSGEDLESYEQNIEKTARDNYWDIATLKRVRRRLKMFKQMCEDLEGPTQLRVSTYRISGSSSFNAFTFGSKTEPCVVITSRWLTSRLGYFDEDDMFVEGPEISGDKIIMRHLMAILAHEFGHIAYNHYDTQNLCEIMSFVATCSKSLVHNSRIKTKNNELKPLLTQKPDGKWAANEHYAKGNGATLWKARRKEYLSLISTYPALVRRLVLQVLSRQHEYQADAWATQFVSASDLGEALTFIDRENKSSPWGFDLFSLINKGLPLYIIISDFVEAVKSDEPWAEVTEWALWYAFLCFYHTHPSTKRRVERLAIEDIHQKSVWTDSECWLTL